MSRLSEVVMRGLARRGLAVQRHPGWRRQTAADRARRRRGARRGRGAGRLRPGAARVRVPGRIVSFEPIAAAFAGPAGRLGRRPDVDLRELRAGKHPGDADDQHRLQQRQQLPVADGRGAPVGRAARRLHRRGGDLGRPARRRRARAPLLGHEAVPEDRHPGLRAGGAGRRSADPRGLRRPPARAVVRAALLRRDARRRSDLVRLRPRLPDGRGRAGVHEPERGDAAGRRGLLPASQGPGGGRRPRGRRPPSAGPGRARASAPPSPARPSPWPRRRSARRPRPAARSSRCA